MRKDFAIFIITHARPTNQLTLNLLLEYGYTGEYYLVLDDQDDVQAYIDLYEPEHIIIFSKEYYFSIADTGLSKQERVLKFPQYARMAIEDYARDNNYPFFLVLDDDITSIRLRVDENGVLKSYHMNGIIDKVLESCIQFVDEANIACASFGFSNTYRSGVSALYKETARNRMCAETFLRNGRFKVDWRPLMIHDLLTSISHNMQGQVWMQLLNIQVDIKMSEGKVDGGSADVYRTFNKFRRVCFPLMMYPSCNYPRFYNGKWITTLNTENSCNKIIGSRYKKCSH